MSNVIENALLSIPAACARIGVSRASLYRLVAQRRLSLVKIGNRSLIDPADLDRLIAAAKRPL